MRQTSLLRLCAFLMFFSFSLSSAAPLRADDLSITSSPSGASVEIDGLAVGTTPCQVKYPGGYFHKTRTVFGTKLEHALTLRVSKAGYATQEIQLTDGPFEWIALSGRERGHYYLLKSSKIAVTLQPSSASSEVSATENIKRSRQSKTKSKLRILTYSSSRPNLTNTPAKATVKIPVDKK
jgi:hypothetical protein